MLKDPASSSSALNESNETETKDSDLVPSRPETDNNMVQSVKGLRNHKQKMIGTSEGKTLDIEESAIYANVDGLHEGLYLDSVICSDTDKMALEIEEVMKKEGTRKEALLRALRNTSKVIPKGGLSRGKNKASTGDVTDENIVESKRKRHRVENFICMNGSKQSKRDGKSRDDRISKLAESKSGESKSGETNSMESKSMKPKSDGKKPDLRKGKGKKVACVG